MPDTPTETYTPTYTPSPLSSVCVSRHRGGVVSVIGEKKFGPASMQFDGSSIVEVDDQQDLNLGTDDFCVELWIKKIAHNDCHLITHGTSENLTDVSFSIRLEADGTVLGLVGANNIFNWLTSGSSKITDTLAWHHIALGRDNEQHLFLMVDGQIVDSLLYELQPTDMVNDSSESLQIGGLYDYPTNSFLEGFIGYVDEVRLSKHGRYSVEVSQGQAPTTAFNCDNYTTLLLHADNDFHNECAYCPPQTITPTPDYPLTATCTILPEIHLTLDADHPIAYTPTTTATPDTLYPLHVSYPIPQIFKVGSEIIISDGLSNEETRTIHHIDIENAIFYLSSELNNIHLAGERITTQCCDMYKGFQFGMSFPENVKHAIEKAEVEINGPTGPTGPIGPVGPAGGVYQESTVSDVLAGNGNTTFVSPNIWFQSANQYVPQVHAASLTNESFTPDALNYPIFDLTYDGSCSLSAPVNFASGRTITILLRRGAAASLSISSEYLFDGGYEQLTNVDYAVDALVATNINGFYFCTIANDIKRL